MKFQPTPAIQNPETEAFCQKMAKEYIAQVQPHQRGSTIYAQAYGVWKARVDVWLQQRSLVRWEVIAMQDRISSVIEYPKDICT